MALFIGQMDAFDESAEQWATYIERFEQFVSANDIADEKRVAVLLSVMGSSTYGLLRSLIAPDKPGAKSYDDIVTVLKDHFSPKPIVIAERFRFHNRSKHETETVAQYVAILKKLSEYCKFGTHLQDALRDCFVCGLKMESVQKWLLTEAALMFQKAVEIAVSMETAVRESQQLSSSLKVHALSLKEKGGDKLYHWGNT